MAFARDGCVVPTQPLSALVDDFAKSWDRTRPSTRGQKRPAAGRGFDHSGAIGHLVERTRQRDPAGLGLTADQIENVKRGRYRHTELRVADALLAAIDRPEALHDGTFGPEPVRPNPAASRAARAACCSGSTPAFEPWSLTGT